MGSNKQDLEKLDKQEENSSMPLSAPTAIREDMRSGALKEYKQDLKNSVTTAVAFLKNAKVRQSPFAQRKAFLQRKGLTSEEIETAIQRSGTAGDENALPARPGTDDIVPVTPQPLPAVPQVSLWTKMRDAISVAVFISGASYGIYHIYKIYVAPKFFGKRPSEVSELEKVTKSVDELRKSMMEVIANIVELQRQLTVSHEEMVSGIKANVLQKGNADLGLMNVSELKDEIKSVKSLLLSRSQFPPTPAVAPVIPAWQLQRNPEAAKKVDNSAVLVLNSSSDQIPAKDDTAEADGGTEKQDTSNPAEFVDSGTASNGIIDDKRDLIDAGNSECIKNSDIVLTDSASDVLSKSASFVNDSTVTACDESSGDRLSNDS